MPFNLQSERRGSTSIYVLKSSPKHTCYITNSLDSGGSRISRRGGMDPLGGRGPPMWVLFGKNVCENERIWSRRGELAPSTPPLDPPMLDMSRISLIFTEFT